MCCMILSIVVGNWRLTWRVSNLCHCVSGEEMIKSPWFAVGSKCLHADTSAFVPFFLHVWTRLFLSSFHEHVHVSVCVCARLVNCPCICVTDVYRGGQLARSERLQGIAAQRPPSLHWGLSPCSNSCAVSSHQVTRSDWTQGAVAADLPAPCLCWTVYPHVKKWLEALGCEAWFERRKDL